MRRCSNGRWNASPRRCGSDGSANHDVGRRAAARQRRRRQRAARHRLFVANGQRSSEVGIVARSIERSRHYDCSLAGAESRSHRTACCRAWVSSRLVRRRRRAHGFAPRPRRAAGSRHRRARGLQLRSIFLVAGCLGARDGLLIENVGINPTRIGLLTIPREMGAGAIELRRERSVGAEPVADLWV